MNTSKPISDRAHSSSYSVLVVDDDAETLRCVGSLLMTHGYQVFVADGGRLAIDIALTVQPDLILLDFVMPDLSGIDTCRALKRLPQTRATPVIFLTGRDDDPGMLEAFDAGGADYVLKPFEARILLARVRAHAELGALSRGLEHALAERTRELEVANARLRRLATDLSLLEEREKARLAGELHDGPLQKLALAQMQLDAGMMAEHMDGNERDQQLAAGVALLREAIAELRTLQFELSPPALHQHGLPAALRWLATDTRSRWGIALRCEVDQVLPPLDRRQSVILFQCVRELVHNVIKHADASSGVIRLSADADGLLLAVEDDGCGFEPPLDDGASTSARGGYGLYHVRERLLLLGGRLDIQSVPIGSRLVMQLPSFPDSRCTHGLEEENQSGSAERSQTHSNHTGVT